MRRAISRHSPGISTAERPVFIRLRRTGKNVAHEGEVCRRPSASTSRVGCIRPSASPPVPGIEIAQDPARVPFAPADAARPHAAAQAHRREDCRATARQAVRMRPAVRRGSRRSSSMMLAVNGAPLPRHHAVCPSNVRKNQSIPAGSVTCSCDTPRSARRERPLARAIKIDQPNQPSVPHVPGSAPRGLRS